MGDEGAEIGVSEVGGTFSGTLNNGASQGQAGLKNDDLATAITVKVGKRKSKECSKTVLKKKVIKTEKTPTLIPVLDDVFDTPEDEPGSIEKAEEAFQWLVGPTNLDKFYKASIFPSN